MSQIDIEEQEIFDSAERYKKAVPLPMRLLAQGVSLIFHPLFILPYSYILLAIFNPFLFGEAVPGRIFSLEDKFSKGVWFVNLLLFSCVIPIVGILLMKALGMVSSLSLPTRDERKIPYIMVGMFYMAMVAQNSYNSSLPIEIKVFALGATIGLFVAFFINLFSKISMHTVGMGGFLGMIIIIIFSSYARAEHLFIFGVLACGLVGTCRMMLGAHKPADIYGGYLVGFVSQFIALHYFYAQTV